MVLLEILTVIVGIIYGKRRLLTAGLILGFIFTIIWSSIGITSLIYADTRGFGVIGFVIFLEIIVIVTLFIVGRYIGFELLATGIILGFIFTMVGSFGIISLIYANKLGFGIGFITFLEVIVLTVLFIIGTYIGDWLRKKQ